MSDEFMDPGKIDQQEERDILRIGRTVVKDAHVINMWQANLRCLDGFDTPRRIDALSNSSHVIALAALVEHSGKFISQRVDEQGLRPARIALDDRGKRDQKLHEFPVGERMAQVDTVTRRLDFLLFK